MPTILNLVDKTRDTWMSQAEFIRPNRRVVNLSRIGLLFADLDTYRIPALAGRDPEKLAASVLYFCNEAGVPAPSLLIYSGRGIQAKWLLEGTIPRQALPRWNACQRYLVDRLAHIGADPMAKDASRVLRTVETVNSKSGEVCRVVHVQSDKHGQPVRYNFEHMAEALLPTARWTIEQQRQEQSQRRATKKLFLLVPGGKADNLRGFSGRQLAWDRLEDLRRLAELRGGVVEGQRMQHLFWRLNFLLLSGATNSKQMYHEAAALARELDPQWNSRSKELMTLFSKAKAYEAGEKVTFGGKEHPPLYTPRNDTLINLFRITPEEQQQLKTIVSHAEAAGRHRRREEGRRRAAGAVDRETYLETANGKLAKAQALRAEGLSVRAIAKRMGVSVMAVSRYINAP
ncbi:replication protein [Pseudomonas syringae]|uniref:replication protein n=1 Tax=Pseudomonas syringae TaxID=317 RepID=UPI001F50DA24|nr:replication protein [Pseudomonas syringae]